MKRIYLLNPPFIEGFCRDARWQAKGRGGTFYYPIWLAYATAQLCTLYKVKLVDAVAKKLTFHEILKDIESFSADIIVVNTSWASLENDLMLAKALENYGRVIPFGVPFQRDDFALYKKLAAKKCLLSLDQIPYVSMIYKRFLNLEDYFYASVLNPHLMLFAGRGCPYGCTFCSRMDGKINRTRSVRNVLDEILWIQTFLPQVKEILFEDATFTVNKRWVRDFCRLIKKRNIDLTWSCQVRADVPLDLLKEMKEAGCRLAICGFESGSNEILKNVKKGITVKQGIKFAKDVKEAGLLLQADFIFGLPGETKKTMKETKDMIFTIKPDILQVSIATPYPNTEFYDWVRENGYLNSARYLDEEGNQVCRINYPDLTRSEIVDAVQDTLMSYYLSGSYFSRVTRQVFARNKWSELKRIWHSAKRFLL